MQLKPSPERRPRSQPMGLAGGQQHGRTLDARRYLELSRRPRLSELTRQRPPYLAAAAAAAAFLFVLYVVLGGV